MAGWRHAAVLLATLGLACSSGKPEVLRTLQHVDRRALLAEASALFAQAGTSSTTVVHQERWPMTFRSFDPSGVRVAPDGVYITTWRRFVEEAGLFIPRDAAFSPRPGQDPSFESLGDQTFWFHIKG